MNELALLPNLLAMALFTGITVVVFLVVGTVFVLGVLWREYERDPDPLADANRREDGI